MSRLLLAAFSLTLFHGPIFGDELLTIAGRPPIVQALFHPGGKRIYFATQAGAEAFDLETGKRLFSVPYSREMTISPNGERLAIVHQIIGMIHVGGSVTVLDAATGEKIREVNGTSAQFSPDGRWLLSATGYDWGHPKTDMPPAMQITDLKSGKTTTSELPSHRAEGIGLRIVRGAYRFTKDSKAIVNGSHDESGRFRPDSAYSLETGKKLERIPAIDELASHPNPQTSADGTRHVANWKVFDAGTGKVLADLEPLKNLNGGWRPHFDLSSDGKSAFTVTFSKRELIEDEKTGRSTLRMATQLHAWDAATGKSKGVVAEAKEEKVISKIAGKKKVTHSRSEPLFAVNPQGTWAVEYGGDAAKVWDLASGQPIRTFRDTGPAGRAEFLAFSTDGKQILAASGSGEVGVWDAATGKPGVRLENALHLNDAGFRPKSQEVLGIGDGGIYAWDMTTGALKRTFDQKGNFFSLALGATGSTAFMGDHWSDAVYAIDLVENKELQRFSVRPVSIAVDPDNGLVYTLDAGGTVILWDVTSRRPQKQWQHGNGADRHYVARRLALLPGGNELLIVDSHGYAMLDTKTGLRTDHRLERTKEAEIRDADMHPGGKRFAIAYAGNLGIEEREIATGKLVRTLPGFHHGTARVRYGAEGTKLVSSGSYAFDLRVHSLK